MAKEWRNPKFKWNVKRYSLADTNFEIRASFVIGNSDFTDCVEIRKNGNDRNGFQRLTKIYQRLSQAHQSFYTGCSVRSTPRTAQVNESIWHRGTSRR